MEVQRVEVRSTNKNTETILSIFHSREDHPGTVYEDVELLKALGLNQKDKMFLYSVNRARSLFYDQTKVRLERVRSVGYRVPTGDQQLIATVCGADRGIRALATSVRRTEEVPVHRLSERGCELRMAALGKLRLIEEIMRGRTLPLFTEMRSFESLPKAQGSA